jgi:hypothetical protein
MRRDPLDVPGVDAGGSRHPRVVQHVSGATVDEPAVVATGPEADVVLLEQRHGQTAESSVASNAGTVHAAPDHDDVQHGRLGLHHG